MTELGQAMASLKRALDVEHQAIAAYTAGIPLLSGVPLQAAKRFLAQEFSHAAELSALIHKGGGQPGSALTSGYPFGIPRGPADVLQILHRVESLLIATYLDAITSLEPGPVRATLASILANEAQHVSVVRLQSGLAPVPAAFVSGDQ
jgi:hypothetical protein